jgi:hypothetical protein
MLFPLSNFIIEDLEKRERKDPREYCKEYIGVKN